MATTASGRNNQADELVRIDATGVAHPIGRHAQKRLRRQSGSTLQVMPAPKNVLVMRDQRSQKDADKLWLAGEINNPGRLLDLCSMVAQSRYKGELAISSRDATRTIFVNDGQVVGAFSTAEPERLGAMLCHFGHMTEDQVLRAMRATSSSVRFGDAAVRLGYITRETLFRFLHKQTEQIVYAAISVGRGTFTFRESYDASRLSFPVSMPFTELLFEGVRRMDEMEFFRARIPSTDHVPTRAEGQSVDPQGEFYSLYLAIDGLRSVNEVAAAAGLELFEATRQLYQLMQSGAVSLRPPRVAGPEGVVTTFNEAIALILAEVDKYRGASQDIRESLASFAASGVVYAPIFRGAGPAEDGTLDIQKVLANVAQMPDLDNPERALAEWLYEYASFAMFIAEPVLRAGSQSDASDVSGRVAGMLAPLAPEL